MPDDPFSDQFSFGIAITSEEGNRAFFGKNVLQGLIDGIDDFVHERQPRWERRTYRIGAPALLGCSPWINDEKLLDAIESLSSACIVTNKMRNTQRLRALNETTSGIPLRALSGLSHKAPKVAGKPLVMGPYDAIDPDLRVPTFRTAGYRTSDRSGPIVHAKLALLGNICWTDEDPLGGVTDYIWFSPKRLWVSSANFTYGSRQSLEFGYWTENTDLLSGVCRFLENLIGLSEDIDAPADTTNPDLADVEFDDDAMAEAAAELVGEEFDEEEC
jgi:hypothetical protein